VLGAFARLVNTWTRHEPGIDRRQIAERALRQVAGVDLNPFAAEIARFRLLVAALDAAGIDRLAAAPDFTLNIATGDSLIHGRHFGTTDLSHLVDDPT
jgi:hypothetical protein